MSQYFSGLGAARVSRGGVYFQPGQYVVEIQRVFMQMTRANARMYIIETVVVESSNPLLPVGSHPAQLINMSQDSAFGNIKGFIAACTGHHLDPDASGFTSAEWELAADESITTANPFSGLQLALECVQIKTRAQTDFTRCDWGKIVFDPHAQPTKA